MHKGRDKEMGLFFEIDLLFLLASSASSPFGLASRSEAGAAKRTASLVPLFRPFSLKERRDGKEMKREFAQRDSRSEKMKQAPFGGPFSLFRGKEREAKEKSEKKSEKSWEMLGQNHLL